MSLAIGIDLGGTKIEGLALDAEGRERARLRVATPSGPYEDTVAAILQPCYRFGERILRVARVTVAQPGDAE